MRSTESTLSLKLSLEVGVLYTLLICTIGKNWIYGSKYYTKAKLHLGAAHTTPGGEGPQGVGHQA